jgi:ABC-type multidrug transport system fused ATPase/permease subunit
LKETIKSIFLILDAGEKRKLTKLTLSGLIMAALDIAFLAGLLLIVNFYTKEPGLTQTGSLSWLSRHNSPALICLFLLLFIIKNALSFLDQRAQHHFFYDVASRLSKLNVFNYLYGEYESYTESNSAVHTRRIGHQPIEFSHYILTNFQTIVSQTVLIAFTVAAILLYHPSLFFMLFLLLLPPVVLVGAFTRKKLRDLRGQTKIASAKTIQHLNESLSGYVESNIYGANDFFTQRYIAYQQQLNNTIAAQQTWQSLPARLMEVFAVLGFFILVAINKLVSSAPAVSMLTIGVFMAAAYKIIPGIVKILNSTGQIKAYDFILPDLVAGAKEHAVFLQDQPIAPVHSIAFSRVSFSYEKQEVLSRLSFDVEAGRMVGISAPSGKGKTTIINILMGFLDQDSGVIRINGKQVGKVERQAYRAKISLVKQQPFFIHDTILKNLTLSNQPENRERLTEVLQLCDLQQLVDSYPQGLNTIITENGKNISGGQRQRFMLARALYHNFDVLILDEPFSEMDAEAEIDLLGKISQLREPGKIILLITHNKASLAWCDKVINLDEVYA